MNRQEFLHELRIALQGEISQRAIDEHVRYYENYIIEESRKGKSEEEVISQLGNPRLIAKTLIDTTEQFGTVNEEEYYSKHYNEENIGFHASYSDRTGWDVRFGKLKLNSWYGKLLMILIAILIIIVAAHIVAFLLPVIIIIVMILLIISLILGSRR